MKRRDFLTGSLAAATLAGVAPLAAAESNKGRQYYELRTYRFNDKSQPSRVLRYLTKAYFPALERLGIGPYGFFTEMEPEGISPVYLLLPFDSLEEYESLILELPQDKEYQKAAEPHFQLPKDQAPFERVESQFMIAFKGMPQLELPAESKAGAPRIFELRTYESYSEFKAQKKVDMFDNGEIDIMKEVNMDPVFFGQKLFGSQIPNLTYMLSAGNRDEHKEHWQAFGNHYKWREMRGLPEYKDTVSKITNVFLEPAPFSQI